MDKLNKLNELLLAAMLDALADPQKCTPGLYQVVRGYLNDNHKSKDNIPEEALTFHENKLTDTIPFKKETG